MRVSVTAQVVGYMADPAQYTRRAEAQTTAQRAPPEPCADSSDPRGPNKRDDSKPQPSASSTATRSSATGASILVRSGSTNEDACSASRVSPAGALVAP